MALIFGQISETVMEFMFPIKNLNPIGCYYNYGPEIKFAIK